MSLVLAIPSKGRLQEQTSAFLADCGLELGADGGARAYRARIAALPGCEVRLLSAGEIAAGLMTGEIHLGVTGEDLLREAAPELSAIVLVRALGFGRADLVVAVPRAWLDVETMADLAAVAAEHRVRTGRRLRVATKYLASARAFFAAHGLDDYRLVESAGATEGAPAAGTAEAIVDITTTGATLAANQLKTLADGVILKSQAQLAASRAATWDEPAFASLRRLLDAMDARGRAKTLRLVRAPLGALSAADRDAILARHGARLTGEPGADLASILVPSHRLFDLAAALAPHGGPLSAFEADYVFEAENPTFERARAALLEKEAPLTHV